MTKLWIDVPEGYLYGFPKVYDPKTDGEPNEFLRRNGYPVDEDGTWIRYWPADDYGEESVQDY